MVPMRRQEFVRYWHPGWKVVVAEDGVLMEILKSAVNESVNIDGGFCRSRTRDRLSDTCCAARSRTNHGHAEEEPHAIKTMMPLVQLAGSRL